MLEKKFTPGTWEQSHRKKKNGMYSTEVYDEETKETIATIAWYPMPPVRELVNGEYKIVTHTYREANAKLISATPDMFNSIVKLQEWSKKYPAGRIYSYGEAATIERELTEIVEQQLKAIQKAVGSDFF